MTATLTPAETVSGLLGQVGITPRGIQATAIEKGLLEGDSVMVSSPTGSGKTLVGEMALLRAVCSGKKGMYLVPLRALATQVADVLKERYEEHNFMIGLATGDYHVTDESLQEHDIIVTTYEKADSLLRHKTEWLSEVGTVVIDEIQNISESRRGARLESVIMRLRTLIDELQIVALSATVGEPDTLAEWLGCSLVESSERPVPLTCRVVPTNDRVKFTHELVMVTVQQNRQALVFNRTRKEAEAEAERLADKVGRQLTTEEKSVLDYHLNSIEIWDVTVPPKLRPLLHMGAAFHHAGLGSRVRRLVEKLFRKGLLKVICSTTTLAAGMDLPARTVVITSVLSPQDYRELLRANMIHQMLGRAGRPGYDKRGFGYIIVNSRGEAKRVKERYFIESMDEVTEKMLLFPKYERITSILGAPVALEEQLLVALDALDEASLYDIEHDFFGDSYLVHLGIRDTKSPMRLVELGEVTAESAIERHALQGTVRAVRQGGIGSVKIREASETVVGGIVVMDGQYTCRFSARTTKSGAVEGPMCSCGRPMDRDSILCTHLVAMGLESGKEEKEIADFVVPLSLSETSPRGVLTRLGLIEGGDKDCLRPTRLGRTVNRLYLSIRTVREMLAILPSVNDPRHLMALLRHLVTLETGQDLDESYENMVGQAATTTMPFEDIARDAEVPVGDLVSLLDRTLWLLHSVTAIAEQGGLEQVTQWAHLLLRKLNTRLNRVEDAENDE